MINYLRSIVFTFRIETQHIIDHQFQTKYAKKILMLTQSYSKVKKTHSITDDEIAR